VPLETRNLWDALGADAEAEPPAEADAAAYADSASAGEDEDEQQQAPTGETQAGEDEARRGARALAARRAREAAREAKQARSDARRAAREAAFAARQRVANVAVAAAARVAEAHARLSPPPSGGQGVGLRHVAGIPPPPGDPPATACAVPPCRPPQTPRPAGTSNVFWYSSVSGESLFTPPRAEELALPGGGGWSALERGFYYNAVTGAAQWERPWVLGHSSHSNGGRLFWLDPAVGGAGSWEPPAEAAWSAHAAADVGGRPFYYNTVTHVSCWERPPALAWSRRSLVATYWWNCVTGESVRDLPPDVFGYDGGQGKPRFFVRPEDGASTWEAPAWLAWTELRDARGRPFFFNLRTRETCWTPPPVSNVAWQRQYEELSAGADLIPRATVEQTAI
jgi:hypothetical protein